MSRFESKLLTRSRPNFDGWHQSTCRDFSTTECENIKNSQFTGAVESWRSGSIGLGDIIANSHNSDMPLTRRPRDIRHDPRDHIMICMVKYGQINLEQSERSVKLKQGDVALYDQSSAFRMNFVGNVRGLVAAIPRSNATSRLSGVEYLTARKLSGASQAARFTSSILNQFQPDGVNGENSFPKNVEASALDLIFGSIGHAFTKEVPTTEARKQLKLREVKEFMQQNLTNSDLNTEFVCKEKSISARSLNRLFSAEGTTPMRWLWQARLDRAYEEISNNRSASITTVAYDCGFSNPSHFSKAFKRSFGFTPSSR